MTFLYCVVARFFVVVWIVFSVTVIQRPRCQCKVKRPIFRSDGLTNSMRFICRYFPLQIYLMSVNMAMVVMIMMMMMMIIMN